jgi:TctA family transporter
MMTTNLDLTWILIWALVISNIMAVVVLIFACRWVTLLTFVRGGLLIPFVLTLCVFGSFLAKGQWENLVMLGILSVIGYLLLKFDWPRPPFAIGLVLGRIAEESLHKALNLWGLDFFLRPLSMLLTSIIVLTIAFAVYKNATTGSKMPEGAKL